MDSVDGIDRMFVSGTRATFTMKKDAKKIDEDALKAALKKNKLEFVSLESREAKRAKAAYVANAPVT